MLKVAMDEPCNYRDKCSHLPVMIERCQNREDCRNKLHHICQTQYESENGIECASMKFFCRDCLDILHPKVTNETHSTNHVDSNLAESNDNSIIDMTLDQLSNDYHYFQSSCEDETSDDVI